MIPSHLIPARLLRLLAFVACHPDLSDTGGSGDPPDKTPIFDIEWITLTHSIPEPNALQVLPSHLAIRFATTSPTMVKSPLI